MVVRIKFVTFYFTCVLIIYCTHNIFFRPQIKSIAIIAEGIPENMTRKIIKAADRKNVTIIGEETLSFSVCGCTQVLLCSGPATVGGIKPGCFKIGNTGGMMDNILHSKLYRPGAVAYVSRSGGMSNELNNIIGQRTNGVFEGVAIGGDRYPVSTFMDHLLRYHVRDRDQSIEKKNLFFIKLFSGQPRSEDARSSRRSRWNRRV